MTYTERFEGKVALVTGGVSGIGAAVVLRLIAEGARVIAADVSPTGIDAFRAEHESDRLEVVTLDVTDSAAVQAAVETIVEKHGHLDLVFANAGIAAGGKAGDIDEKTWHQVIAVDLHGVFNTVRAAIPHLIESKGSVVNTASISGLGGDVGLVAYNTAKGAVVNLTRSLAVDYGHDGVRVNAVAPGMIYTPMAAPILDAREDVRQANAERVPLGRPGQAEEVAAVMLFLASDDASYVSGVTLPVDGGLTSWTSLPVLLP